MPAVTRARIGGLVFIVALLYAWAAVPARGAAPAGYTVTRVDAPRPVPFQAFGSRMAAADLDFDGASELVVPYPGTTPGEIEVIARKTDGSDMWTQQLDPDPASSSAYRVSVALLVDVQTGTDINGDFVPDVAVGAVDTNAAAGDQGRVYVLDGASGQVLKRLELPSADQPAGTAEFGHAVLSPGDMAIDSSFDQAPDLVVSAPGLPGGGAVYVYRGSDLTGDPTGAVSPAHAVKNPFGNVARFGETLVPIGDAGHCIDAGGGVDCTGPSAEDRSDGAPDVFVGAPASSVAGLPNAGSVLLLDGRRGKLIRKIDNPSPQIGGRFGDVLQRLPEFGDVNGDTVPDALVGAPGHGAEEGTTYFVNGNLNSPVVAFPLRDPDPAIGARFGAATFNLGADGLAVGAPFGATVPGEVRLFNPNFSLARTICDPDNQAGARFGASIVSLGFLNADAFPDLAVAAPGADHSGAQDTGRVYVLTSTGDAVSGRRHSCARPGGGGTGGDPDPDPIPDPDPDPGFEPPDPGTVVTARVLRRLSMKPNRKRVRKRKAFRLRGRLRAASRRTVCQRRQKVALQRRKGRRGRFQTFEVAVTRSNGRFSARAYANRTYNYRARVSTTRRCMGAVSKTSKVRVKRSKKRSKARR